MNTWAAGPHREPRTELHIVRVWLPIGVGLLLIALATASPLYEWMGPAGTIVAMMVGLAGAGAALFGLVSLCMWVLDRR